MPRSSEGPRLPGCAAPAKRREHHAIRALRGAIRTQESSTEGRLREVGCPHGPTTLSSAIRCSPRSEEIRRFLAAIVASVRERGGPSRTVAPGVTGSIPVGRPSQSSTSRTPREFEGQIEGRIRRQRSFRPRILHGDVRRGPSSDLSSSVSAAVATRTSRFQPAACRMAAGCQDREPRRTDVDVARGRLCRTGSRWVIEAPDHRQEPLERWDQALQGALDRVRNIFRRPKALVPSSQRSR
jgi:hypothetical protein